MADPGRRALYEFVVAQPEAVGRDEAARGVDVPHHVAKFHLDKLVEHGLLDVEYRRPPGRSGPGAGRPAKLYRRSARELDVTIPERRYELAGRLLADAVTRAEDDRVSLRDAIVDAATAAGANMGDEVRRRVGPRPSRPKIMGRTVDVLTEYGYDPRVEANEVTLKNCPFHRLAQDYTELICGVNHCLLGALVAHADPDGRTGLDAVLEPSPDACCVRLRGHS